MHTPPGAFCCCKPAQSTNRLEPVIRRAWQSVLGETSPGHLAVELAPNSSQGRTTDGLRVWSAEVAAREPGAAAPPPLAPKVLLQSPAGRPCACGGSYRTPAKAPGRNHQNPRSQFRSSQGARLELRCPEAGRAATNCATPDARFAPSATKILSKSRRRLSSCFATPSSRAPRMSGYPIYRELGINAGRWLACRRLPSQSEAASPC